MINQVVCFYFVQNNSLNGANDRESVILKRADECKVLRGFTNNTQLKEPTSYFHNDNNNNLQRAV